jgi:hypothetical protein
MVVIRVDAKIAAGLAYVHMVVERINAKIVAFLASVHMVVEKIVAKIAAGLATVHMVVKNVNAKIVAGRKSVHMVVKKLHARIVEALVSVRMVEERVFVIIVGSSACHAAEWWAKKTSGVMIANQSHLAGPRSKRRALRQSLGSGRLKDSFQSSLHGIVPIQKAKRKSVARTGLISHGILGIGL